MGSGASTPHERPTSMATIRWGPDELFKSSALCREGKAAVSIQGTEDRAITLSQFAYLIEYVSVHCTKQRWTSCNPRTPDKELDWCTIDLYDVMHWVVKPATKAACCSYVELIAEGKQIPKWFVSHWWGEPVKSFYGCLKQHALDRNLADPCAYWVCAYANNQWKLLEEVGDDPAKSSFRRAMDKCDGTITVLDESAIAFTRIWCSYEVFVALLTKDHRYDVYTAIRCGEKAVGLVDGRAAAADFPFERLKTGMMSEVQKAEACIDADRVHILNAIAGVGDLNATPPQSHEHYDFFNQLLHGRLALQLLTCMPSGECSDALTGKLVSAVSLARDMDLRLDVMKDPPFVLSVLKSAVPRGLKTLNITWQCNNLGSDAGVLIAEAIQDLHSVTQLRIDLAYANVGTAGALSVISAVKQLPAVADLYMSFRCNGLDNEVARSLAEVVRAMPAVREVQLDLENNDLGLSPGGIFNRLQSELTGRRKEPVKIEIWT